MEHPGAERLETAARERERPAFPSEVGAETDVSPAIGLPSGLTRQLMSRPVTTPGKRRAKGHRVLPLPQRAEDPGDADRFPGGRLMAPDHPTQVALAPRPDARGDLPGTGGMLGARDRCALYPARDLAGR